VCQGWRARAGVARANGHGERSVVMRVAMLSRHESPKTCRFFQETPRKTRHFSTKATLLGLVLERLLVLPCTRNAPDPAPSAHSCPHRTFMYTQCTSQWSGPWAVSSRTSMHAQCTHPRTRFTHPHAVHLPTHQVLAPAHAILLSAPRRSCPSHTSAPGPSSGIFRSPSHAVCASTRRIAPFD
jgi:hypothetical protein